MRQIDWFPKEKKAKIKGVAASKPILICLLIVLGYVLNLGIKEDPVGTLSAIFLSFLGYFFVRILLNI